MSLWSRFPFARISLALAGGILMAYSWDGWWHWIPKGILAGALFVYVFIIALAPITEHRSWSPVLGLLGLGSVFLMGYLRFEVSESHRASDHLMQLNDSVVAYEAIALGNVSRKSERCSVIVAVRRARVQGVWQRVQGKIRLSLSQDTAQKVRYGDVLLVLGAPSIVPAGKNPYEFNYASFLQLSQVYHQHFLKGNEFMVIGQCPPNLIQAWSFKVLHYCQSLLAQHIHGTEALAVVQALVLGQKDALTPAVQAAYSGTGTMHVLAVSGLHVGILYWLVSLLLGFLRPLPYMRWLSPILSTSILWFYAFVTGLSPSVLRATLMFTLMVLAPMLARNSNIYNTLAASAFLLLFWQPKWLFSVSFQLSYLAVLGIVYLQPRLYSCVIIRHPFFHKVWGWTSVSLAAQIATFPISLYYFHQFPVYFLVANWLVVPAALLILCLGLLTLATGSWPSLSGLIACILEKVVEGVNTFVTVIQALPGSTISNIHLSATAVFLLYGFLLFWLLFWHTRKLRYGVAAGMLIALLSLNTVHSYLIQQTQKKVIFYSIGHHQVVGFFKGRQGIFCTDDRFEKFPKKYDYHVQPSQIALGITSSFRYTFDEATKLPHLPLQTWCGLQIVVWQGKKFLFVNKGSRPMPCLTSKLHIDFLVAENNALTKLLPSLQVLTFDTLVIGASNTTRVVEQLQEEARIHDIVSHSLRQQGALSISW